MVWAVKSFDLLLFCGGFLSLVSGAPKSADPIGMLAVDSVLFEFCTDGVDRSASFDFNTAGGWRTKQPIYRDDLPIDTAVVGIHAKNLGGGGGLFLSSEIASTGSPFWKCLREPPSGDWCKENYDDAAWTPAVLYDYRKQSWLWYKSGGDDKQDVWFRWERKCVIKEFENATIIGHEPGTVVNISQPVTLVCMHDHVTPQGKTTITSTCDKKGKWSIDLADCRPGESSFQANESGESSPLSALMAILLAMAALILLFLPVLLIYCCCCKKRGRSRSTTWAL